MPLGTLFWVVYVLSIILSVWSSYEANQPLWYRRAGAYLVLWVLVGMLGWKVFGSVIK